MKVYTRLVFDWDGNVLDEDSFEYEGPVAAAKGGGGGGTSTTVQKADPWSGVQPYLKQGYADAQSLYEAGGPQYFPFQTYAPRDPLENVGQQFKLNYAQNRMPQQVNQALQTQTGLLGAADVANNPIVSGIADVMQRRLNRNLTENQLPAIRSGAVASGQLGGSNQRIAEGIALRGAQEAQGDALAQLYGSAYGQGLDASGKALQIAPQTMQLGYMPAQGIAEAGAYRRGENELELQDAMGRYNYNQQLPYSNLSNYMNLLQGAPWGSTSTSDVSGAGRGGFSGSGALGGALGGASLAGALSLSNPLTAGLALGGGLLGGFF